MIDYNKLSDFDLTILIKSSDNLAFTEVFKRYNSLLYAHAVKKFSSREEARDIVQEVFCMIWDKRETLEPKSNLAGYLYVCIHHKLLNWIGHKKIQDKYISYFQRTFNENRGTTDNLIRERQLSAIIQKEIDLLPPKIRETFELSRHQQLSHKEIAKQMNLSEETVKSYIKSALKTLRAKLGIVKFLTFLIFY